MEFLTRRCICAALAMWALASMPGIAAAPSEYHVKAVFLFNFAQFVDWPDGAFDDPASPLVIGVLGTDPFGSALEDVVEGETVNGRPLAIRRYATVNEIAHCHILFINLPKERLAEVLEQMRERNVLTVSDAKEFARAGGVIELLTIDNKIRLQINLDAAKLSNLTISSKLLRPARIVGRG